MKIKITLPTNELLNEFINSVLNIACVIANRGDIPHESDSAFWTLFPSPDRYDLSPVSNNYWAYIRERGDNFIVLEFAYRYGNTGLCDALCLLLKARFRDEIEILE